MKSAIDALIEGLQTLIGWLIGQITQVLSDVVKAVGTVTEEISKTAIGLWNTARDLYREQWSKRTEEWDIGGSKAFKDALIEGGASEDVADRIVDETMHNPYYVGGITLISRLFIGGMLALKSSLTAFVPFFERMHASRYRPVLLPPADAIIIDRRNKAETPRDMRIDFDLRNELANQGFSEDRIDGLLSASYNAMPWPDAMRLHAGGLLDDEMFSRFAAWNNIDDASLAEAEIWEHRPLDFNTILPFLWREIYDHDQALTELAYAGWTPGQAEGLLELSELIPAPPDLVRMAVREVFTPEIAEAFGQFEDLPPDFTTWMAKQGYSEMWAKYYWGAHWDLPSVQQGFEMLHRDKIEMPQLEFLLRALDIMPNWREPLKEIAYRLLTRVDVRRMHKTGVLSVDQVHKAYRHLGYAPDDADLMTDFTLEYNAQDDRELSKSEVLKAYKSPILLQDETIGMLRDLGYDDDSIAVLIVQIDLDRHNKIKTTRTRNIRKQFDARIISDAETIGRLSELPTDGNEATELVSIWRDERMLNEVAEITPDSLPSRADLVNFVKADAMGKIGFYQTMGLRKFAPVYIDLYWLSLPAEVREQGEQYDADNAELSDETG